MLCYSTQRRAVKRSIPGLERRRAVGEVWGRNPVSMFENFPPNSFLVCWRSWSTNALEYGHVAPYSPVALASQYTKPQHRWEPFELQLLDDAQYSQQGPRCLRMGTKIRGYFWKFYPLGLISQAPLEIERGVSLTRDLGTLPALSFSKVFCTYFLSWKTVTYQT